MVAPQSILEQLGFVQSAGSGAKRRLFITGEGATGSGKTRFLTTCPGPIAVVDFDKGLEGVAEFDQRGERILRKTFEVPDFDEHTAPDSKGMSAPAVSQSQLLLAKKSYEGFKETVEKILKTGACRTLCVDNGGLAYSLAQAARFGQIARIGEVPSQMWRAMQYEYENIFSMAYDHNVNLYVTHRQKLKFKGVMGEKQADGFPGLVFAAQVHLVFEKKVSKAADKSTDIQMLARVDKCRQRIGLEGTEFPVIWLDAEKTQSIGLDFLTIATAVLPNTTEQDWF